MLLRTHLAIAVLFIILFIPNVEHEIIFTLATLIATLIPDIDSGYSTIGKNKFFRFFQFFIRHRGFIHSFTICIILSGVLVLLLPVASLGFFLGYGLHLFLDSFTVEGIMPLWPWRKTSRGYLKTGGRVESIIFLSAVILDIVIFILFFVV